MKLLRTRLANAKTLTKIVERIDKTKAPLADSALYVATLAKKPALAAYEISKPYADRDKEFGKLLNKARNLYRERAMAGVRARQAKKSNPSG